MAPCKSTASIQPFPAEIDRTAFANYITGLTDGEGCFGLLFYTHKGYASGCCRFSMRIRADDYKIVMLMQSYFQCGTRYFTPSKNPKWNPTVEFCVNEPSHCLERIIPHFTDYPLRAKKARDFVIWKEGVEFVSTVRAIPFKTLSTKGLKRTEQLGFSPRWTAELREQFAVLVQALRSQRDYVDQQVDWESLGFSVPKPRGSRRKNGLE